MGYKFKQCLSTFAIVVILVFGLWLLYAVATAPMAKSDSGSARVEVVWTGAPCIDVVHATGRYQTICGGAWTFYGAAESGYATGVDPIMGDATSISCTFYLDGYMEYYDLALRGDGTDVNCLRYVYDVAPKNGMYV